MERLEWITHVYAGGGYSAEVFGNVLTSSWVHDDVEWYGTGSADCEKKEGLSRWVSCNLEKIRVSMLRNRRGCIAMVIGRWTTDEVGKKHWGGLRPVFCVLTSVLDLILQRRFPVTTSVSKQCLIAGCKLLHFFTPHRIDTYRIGVYCCCTLWTYFDTPCSKYV
jgi:hypothetical protein